MRDFRNLKVWEKAHRLNLDVYKATEKFPSEEKYGITSQVRRASVSIATNISEGCGHSSLKEFSRYLQIATASSSEVEYLLILSKDLNLLNVETGEKLITQIIEIRKMLYSLSETNKSKIYQ